MVYTSMIIGLGQIGMGYDLDTKSPDIVYSHAKALTTHPQFKLVCGVDACQSKLSIFSERFGLPTYATVREALQNHEIDLVVIATPTETHCETLHEILRHTTPTLVLCEKPLSYSQAEAESMIELCERTGVLLFTNYIRRADPSSLYIKTQIESGKIGGPIKGVTWYSKGLLHNGSHLFDLLKFWLGPLTKTTVINKGRRCNDRDYEPDFLAEFSKGSIIFMAAWEESYSHHTIELVSPDGRLRYDRGGDEITWQSAVQDSALQSYRFLETPPREIPNEQKKYQWLVSSQLADAAQGKPHNLCTGKESLETLGSILNIFRLIENEQ